MEIFKCFSIENWLTLISIIFAGIAGSFVYWQWRKNVKTKRAEFINQIIEKLRFDKNLINTMYKIEYNQDWYDDTFHNGDLESDVDKLFSYIDYICYLRKTGNISKVEYKIFKYEINRVCISNSSQCYLWNLYHFSLKNSTTSSFQYLIDYGIKSKIFPQDFKSNNFLFKKTLNW